MTDLNDGAAADSNAENNSTDVSPVKSANEGIVDKAENSVGADVNAAADNAGLRTDTDACAMNFRDGIRIFSENPNLKKRKNRRKKNLNSLQCSISGLSRMIPQKMKNGRQYRCCRLTLTIRSRILYTDIGILIRLRLLFWDSFSLP